MRRIFLSCASLLIFSLPTTAETYIVTPEGSGDFLTIQAAIDAAAEGDLIKLADGTFTGDGNRDIEFLGKAITVRSDNGLPTSCIIDCEGSAADPHRGFLFIGGEGPNTILQDIKVTHGYIPDVDPLSGGGAILCSSSPTISGCVLENNVAFIGGGLSCPEGNPTVSGCIFSANVGAGPGSYGGGVYCGSWGATFSGCVFNGNQASDGWGGGMMILWGSSVTLIECLFLANSAQLGGAFFCDQVAMVAFNDCVFAENSAATAGAVAAYGSLHATGCTFSGNQAASGGVVYYTDEEAASATLASCTLADNTTTAGGAIECNGCGSLTLENTIIASSTAGPAVHHHTTSTPDLVCCDLFGNQGGDWIGGIAGQLGQDGNISEDPRFCGPDDFTLEDCSPCAPHTPPNEECDLIGAWPVSCPGSPVRRTSWGRIKADFRGAGR